VQIITELKNTAGSMDCISKDASTCTLDNISMSDNENGDFAANFDDPVSITDDISAIKQ
jgi:hypothetical protein